MIHTNFVIMSPNYNLYEVRKGKIVNGQCTIFVNDVCYHVMCYNDDELRTKIGVIIQDLDFKKDNQ